MATQTSGSTIVEDEKPRAFELFLILGFVVILSILLALQVVNRWLAFELEEGPDGSSATLLSPIGTFPLRRTPAGNFSLLLAVYPDSKPEEQAALDWTDGPGATTKRQQLTILTYQTGAPVEQLDSWYQKRLGSSFARSKGWPVAGNEKSSTWMHRIESRPQPEAITFRQELPHRARGILICPAVAGQVAQIRLYDYMEAPAQ